MKKKSVIAILSVVLNLVLFSALAYSNKVNSNAVGAPPPFFICQHLPDLGYVQSDGHAVALASAVK